MNDSQYILPFEEARNTLLARIRGLRNVDTGLTIGRVEGVCQLLERLVILSNDLTEHDGRVRIKAQATAIAARIDGRRTVSDRTIRNWRRDAEQLGVLDPTEVTSQHRGGHHWNTYVLNIPTLRQWVTGQLSPALKDSPPQSPAPTSPSYSGGSGRKRPEMISAPRPETLSAPGPEMVSALTQCHTQTHTPRQETDEDWAVVVSELLDLGVSMAAAAVDAGRRRGASPRDAQELIETYRRRKARGQPVQPAWLYRWIAGQSVPDPETAAPQRSNLRGDALSRDQQLAAFRRDKIVKDGRRRGLDDSAIAKACTAAGVEY